jgi:hypothetical protein
VIVKSSAGNCTGGTIDTASGEKAAKAGAEMKIMNAERRREIDFFIS